MILPFEVLFILIWSVEGVDITYNQLNNKTKRTLSQHLFNYGETKPILVYKETFVPHVLISDDFSNLKSEYKSPVPLDLPEPVKFYRPQHPPQQRFYEFPKLVSNGQVFNSDDQLEHYKEKPLTGLTTVVDNQNFVPAESVSLPVEHRESDVTIPHYTGYPNANFRYKLVPLRKQITHGSQKGNYELYNSLRIPLYQQSPYSNQYPYQPQVHNVPLFSNPYSSQLQNVQSVPNVNYINRNYSPRRENLNNLKHFPTLHGRSNSLHRKPLQINYSPLKAPFKKNGDIVPKNQDEELEIKETRKIEDSNGEKKSFSEEEENEQDSSFHKHPYDFGKNDHFDYKDPKDLTEEEYDQDNKRSSTTHIPLKKHSSKHSKNGKSNTKNYYKFQNGDYKQEHSKPRSNKNDNKTARMIYKSFNFAKETDDTNEDSIEGKQSENVPVTRKHRLLREKWYLSKNIDDVEKE